MKQLKVSKGILVASLWGIMSSAQAGLAIIVNPGVGEVRVNKEEVRDIFLGKLAQLPNGKKVIAIDQGPGDVRDQYLTKLLAKSDSQVKAYWAQLVFAGRGQPPKQVADSEEVKVLVAENPNMIGYIDTSEADATVKVLFTID